MRLCVQKQLCAACARAVREGHGGEWPHGARARCTCFPGNQAAFFAATNLLCARAACGARARVHKRAELARARRTDARRCCACNHPLPQASHRSPLSSASAPLSRLNPCSSQRVAWQCCVCAAAHLWLAPPCALPYSSLLLQGPWARPSGPCSGPQRWERAYPSPSRSAQQLLILGWARVWVGLCFFVICAAALFAPVSAHSSVSFSHSWIQILWITI